MKKFWIVLLALGLVAGFAMSASAADVKFSGQYYLYGIYNDNPGVRTGSITGGGITSMWSPVKKDDRTVTPQAYFYQRLRIQTEFKVAEGLSLVTRFDALEKAWGQGYALTTGWKLSNNYDTVNRPSFGNAEARVQENIEWERAYIDMTTKIGRFMIGYQNFIAFGTPFLDTHLTIPGIKYMVPVGPVIILAALEKKTDQNAGFVGAVTGATNNTFTDADYTSYDLGAIYKFGIGEAGIMGQYAISKATKPYDGTTTYPGAFLEMWVLDLYTKLKFGPVYVEAEALAGGGKSTKAEPVTLVSDVDGSAYGLYLHVKADLGPAYVGGIFAYMSGDDPTTTDKKEGGFAAGLNAGLAWDPCVILWNDGITGANGRIANHVGGYFDNAFLYQIYAGFKPVKAADIMMSLTYAYADQKPAIGGVRFLSGDYGWEVDLVAKYKIFDNLEYQIGGGYLLAGDFFKGTDSTKQIDNNYVLFHKLNLTF